MWWFCGIVGGPWLFLRVLQMLADYGVSLEEEAAVPDGTESSCGHFQGEQQSASQRVPSFLSARAAVLLFLHTHAWQGAWCQVTHFSPLKTCLVAILTQFYCVRVQWGTVNMPSETLGKGQVLRHFRPSHLPSSLWPRGEQGSEPCF